MNIPVIRDVLENASNSRAEKLEEQKSQDTIIKISNYIKKRFNKTYETR